MRGHLDISYNDQVPLPPNDGLPFDTYVTAPSGPTGPQPDDLINGDTSLLYEGMSVSGPGIPLNAKIHSITDSTSLKIWDGVTGPVNATATGSQVPLFFSHIRDVERYGFITGKWKTATNSPHTIEYYTTRIKNYYDGSIKSSEDSAFFLTNGRLNPIIKTIINPRYVSRRIQPKYLDIKQNPLKADVVGFSQIEAIDDKHRA